MAIGKNKKFRNGGGNGGGKKGGKKVVDTFEKKEWYDVKAPNMFTNRQIEKTLVTRSSGLKLAADSLRGRVYDVCQADLENDGISQKKFSLICEEVVGKDCLTNFHGMHLTTDKTTRLVVKGQTMIEANVTVTTTDGYKLRLFAMGFTKRHPNQAKKGCYAQTSQSDEIRANMVDIMTREVCQCTMKQVVLKLIPDSIGSDIEKECQGIFPLKNVCISKVKVLQKPSFDIGRLLELHPQSRGHPDQAETVTKPHQDEAQHKPDQDEADKLDRAEGGSA